MKPGQFSKTYGKKMPAMKIAGLCLPLKPQKERIYKKKQLDPVSLLRTNSENCESLLKKSDTQT